MSLLRVEGLWKSFVTRRSLFGRPSTRVDAVRGVSLGLGPGRTLALVGESGAGKSTVGRLVLRLVPADRGRVLFEGVDVLGLRGQALRRLRRRMQMIFQDPYSSLDPRVPVGDSVAEPLLVHFGTDRRERLRSAAELLERVGLSASDMPRYPDQLSGGQLQRVAIARALTVKPSLIVCDEPVSALDVSVRAQVLNLMRDLQDEFGLAYLFITHDLALVRVMADDVTVMRAGEVVEHGAVAEVLTAPRNPYTQNLLAAVPSVIPRSLR